jgi:hypothetical protein
METFPSVKMQFQMVKCKFKCQISLPIDEVNTNNNRTQVHLSNMDAEKHCTTLEKYEYIIFLH